jgi:3-oxoacyl-[acyl-carrier protein] reductase
MERRERVMVMTGAAGGIGHHLASCLYAQGHRLWLTDLDLSALRKAAQKSGLDDEQRVAMSALDVRDPDAWRDLVQRAKERFGRIDVLFNIAGVMRAEPITEASTLSVDLHFDINAKGAVHGTRAVVPLMINQGEGHIVNLSSLMGIAALPGFALYSASKHAVRGFSIATALELRPFGISVTVVCPDAVQTSMLDAQLDSDAARIAFSGPSPLTKEELVDAIIDQALPRRPLELTLAPKRSGRALLCKIVGAAPGLAVPLEPIFSSVGNYVQRRRRKQSRTP